jgi:hypothetical protein
MDHGIQTHKEMMEHLQDVLNDNRLPKSVKLQCAKIYCKDRYEEVQRILLVIPNIKTKLEGCIYGYVYNNNLLMAQQKVDKFKKLTAEYLDTAMFDDAPIVTHKWNEETKTTEIFSNNSEAIRISAMYIKLKHQEFDLLMKFL